MNVDSVVANLVATSFEIATVNSSINSAALDLSDYEDNIAILLTSPAGTGTNPTLNVKVQDSADNSTFADVSPALSFTQIGASASTQKKVINKNKLRRYVRLYYTIGGTDTPAFTKVASTLLGHKKYI